MKKTILMTRPRAASLRWASSLVARDYECLIDPLLRVETIPGARPHGDFQAVIFTSTNAPEALLEQGETLSDLLALPCFCVGPSTGAAARAFGFTDIRCGASDSGALAELIIAQITAKERPLLHVCGETAEKKAYDALDKAGVAVMSWPIYRAVAADDLAAETLARFRADGIDIVPVFSPRSARILVSLIEKNRLVQQCHRIVAIGLSPAVADVLRTLPWRRLRVAAAPREDEVLACLAKEEELMAEPHMPAAPVVAEPSAPPPSAFRRFKARLAWYAFGILVVVGCGLTPFVYDRFISERPPAPLVARDLPPAAALVAVTRPETPPVVAEPSAPSEPPTAVAPSPIIAPPVANVAALARLEEDLKKLQAEVAQLRAERIQAQQVAQTAARAWASAALSCWDMRAALRDGRPFGPALAALRQQTAGNVEVANAIDLLVPYSGGVDSLPKLQAALAAAAQKLSPPAEVAVEEPAWLTRARAAVRALINIHPVRADLAEPLLDAMASGDFAAAGAAYAALPDWAREQLGPWHERFDRTRAAVAAGDALTAILAAPVPSTEGAR